MNRKVLFISVGFILLLVVGYLAGQVGGIAIRRVATQGGEVTLNVADPVLPGVETVVRFSAPVGRPNTTVSVNVRTAEVEKNIGEGRLSEGRLAVTFPCDMAGRTAGVQLIDLRTGQLLASKQVRLLAAGPDCVN